MKILCKNCRYLRGYPFGEEHQEMYCKITLEDFGDLYDNETAEKIINQECVITDEETKVYKDILEQDCKYQLQILERFRKMRGFK